uniref:RNA-dependent RNA polymerase n=1 Tax=Podosphaera prunicola partitivirus 1 TaxID=2052567 RepID=A0A2P9JAN3_9VIRU|nr:RNA-dependent RNA polymerase [Podosphaera prunicola partitivirus 1]
MCFSKITNLERLGKKPVNRRLRRQHDRVSKRTQLFTQRATRKAIYKTCPPQIAEQAINGYYRSPTDPAAAEEDFLKTDQPYIDVPRDYHYLRALRAVEKMFRPSRRLRPIAFPDLRYYPWSLNTSAEAPYRESDEWYEYVKQKHREQEVDDERISFHNLYDELFNKNRGLIHLIKEGKQPFWDSDGNPVPYEFTYLHSRAHMVSSDRPPRIRAVFGVPKLLLMAENMFIWNLQKEYLNRRVNRGPLLWGYETFRGGWTHLVQRLCGKQINSIISADWSGFDHNALHEVIDDIHQMWRRWFDFDSGYEPSISNNHDYSDTETDEIRIQRLWDWMCYSIKRTPIKAESGNMYRWKFNGFASGFQQTQLLGSFINATYILTSLSACGINIDSDHFQALFQGDDSITTFPERVDFKTFIPKVSNEAKRRFNANLSIDKTTYGDWFDGIEVLSYAYRGGFAVRDPASLLAHLLYPERPKRPEELAASCIGIAQASMGIRCVYDACLDLFTFLVEELKIEPYFPETDLNRPFKWWEPTFRYFPTFEECFLQNFEDAFRDQSVKNRLWPTQPVGNGFCFLLP